MTVVLVDDDVLLLDVAHGAALLPVPHKIHSVIAREGEKRERVASTPFLLGWLISFLENQFLCLNIFLKEGYT